MMKRPDLKIIYEDRWLIVADKPSGMLTMSTGKADEITAYSILTDYVRDNGHSRSMTGNRIFIVHRLDRDTSGLLVFAKDQAVKELLQKNWNDAVLQRTYLAVLEGKIEDSEGWIETWLYENPKSMKVHCHAFESGDDRNIPPRKGWQFASSHCRTIKHMDSGSASYTLVEFELETGRKNQIRAHSQWIGHPVAGDRKYGAATNPTGRLCLHAHALSFIHPVSGKTMRFTSSVPKSFRII